MQTKFVPPSPLVLTLRENLSKTLSKLLDKTHIAEAFGELAIFAGELSARAIILRSGKLNSAAKKAGFTRLHIFSEGRLVLTQPLNPRRSGVAAVNSLLPPGCVAYRSGNVLLIECLSKQLQAQAWNAVTYCAHLLTVEEILIETADGGVPISVKTETLKRRRKNVPDSSSRFDKERFLFFASKPLKALLSCCEIERKGHSLTIAAGDNTTAIAFFLRSRLRELLKLCKAFGFASVVLLPAAGHHAPITLYTQ